MERSLSAENARLRALLVTQQQNLKQMAGYNRLLSQRLAAYASETAAHAVRQQLRKAAGENAASDA